MQQPSGIDEETWQEARAFFRRERAIYRKAFLDKLDGTALARLTRSATD